MTHRWTLAATIGAASVVGYRKAVRPWHERWGATDDDVTALLPGDEFTEEPAVQVTRAISIDASPEVVWPWVIQLGADRGGFYSYDWLENLFHLGIHSVDEIVPEWQRRAVGDLVYGNDKGSGGWLVMEVRPNQAFVLKTANPKSAQPLLRNQPPAFWEFTWAFILSEQTNGTTRLIVRERVGFGSRISQLLMSPFGLVSFVMTRKMMSGIKARAEALHRETSSAAHDERKIG